jgi:peptidoglycan/LPS O-acetylase OafA/YrhL
LRWSIRPKVVAAPGIARYKGGGELVRSELGAVVDMKIAPRVLPDGRYGSAIPGPFISPPADVHEHASAAPTIRLQGVEGFRAVAVLAVLVYHNWLYTAAGGSPADLGALSRWALPHLPVGVTLFFTLSGFLLYRPIASRILSGRSLQSLRSYFRNRGLRIVPAYWAILLATGVLLPATLISVASSEVQLGRLIEQPSVLIRNALLMQNYFAGSIDTGIPPAWSLAVEIVFYLILPFLGTLAALLAARASTRRGRMAATLMPPVLLFGVGMVTAWVWAAIRTSVSENVFNILGRSFLNHADLFSFGMLLAVLTVAIENGAIRLPSWWRMPGYALFVTLVGVTAILADRGVIYIYRGAVPYELLTGAAAALLLALVVLPSANASMSILTRMLDARVFVSIGLISYSLFLWHEPLQRLADEWGWTVAGARGFWVNLLILGVVSLVLATLTYQWVERPALVRKNR